MIVMMRALLIEITTGYLWTFLSLKEKVNSPFSHLMKFEDYLVASGMRIEPDEEGGQRVQPDYRDIINKFKASLKNNARVWFSMYIEDRVPIYIQQIGGKQ